MARYEWYILRVWCSGHRPGEQWAARIEHMPDGESLRFNHPDRLFDHLRTLILPITTVLERTAPDGECPPSRDDRQTEPR